MQQWQAPRFDHLMLRTEPLVLVCCVGRSAGVEEARQIKILSLTRNKKSDPCRPQVIHGSG